jgi:tRNA(fMet)-specific endonuclease VapC
MKYLLDTNTISYFVRGEPAVLSRLRATRPELVAVSSVTAMEIEYGLQLNPSRARKLAPVLNALFQSIETLPYALEDARVTGALRASLRKAGKPVGYYDVMVAGTALRHGLTLVTSNTRELAQISGLLLEDWRD